MHIEHPLPEGFAIAFKCLAVVFVLVIGYNLIRLRKLGQQLAAVGPYTTETASTFSSLESDKRGRWVCVAGNLFLAILTIEGLVQLLNPGREHPLIFWIHLPAAIAFLTLVIVLWFQTGRRSRTFHRIAGYSALVLFSIALVTGAILLVPM